jgi:phospholipase/carboxylesterase
MTTSIRRPRAAAWMLWVALAGCGESDGLVNTRFGSARLETRPLAPTALSSLRGEVPLGDEEGEHGLLLVPPGYAPGTPAALVVLLHGARGSPEGILPLLREQAAATGTLVLAPRSWARTWDVIASDAYKVDLQRLDASLARVFREYAVDPERVSISGFSDGATYALSVGLSNGDLFGRIAAFSPGGAVPSELKGRPPVFISHGTLDPVLPVPETRRLVELLRDKDYPVDYREFEGAHAVPKDVAQEAFGFLTGLAP